MFSVSPATLLLNRFYNFYRVSLSSYSLQFRDLSIWHNFHGLRGKGFPTDNRHSHGYKLCPLSPTTYVCTHTKQNSYSPCSRSVGNGHPLSSTSYIDDVLSINNPDFENYLGQMYHPELEIKDTTESSTSASYLDFLLSIGRDGQLRISFTTSLGISISILQSFRSWLATSHRRPPMAFLSHNSSDKPRLSPLMNVLLWGRCNFPISFSGRDMARNV